MIKEANYAGKLEIPDIRRRSICELVYHLQDIKICVGFGPQGQNLDAYHARLCKEIERELGRRKSLPPAQINADTSIIAAVKERADIVEVLGQFAEVFTHQKLLTYKCPLHSDNHPSGKIYPDQNKAWCYQCQKGGDVIDMVQLLGKTDIKGALSWLCKFYGINPQIIPVTELKPEYEKYINALY